MVKRKESDLGNAVSRCGSGVYHFILFLSTNLRDYKMGLLWELKEQNDKFIVIMERGKKEGSEGGQREGRSIVRTFWNTVHVSDTEDEDAIDTDDADDATEGVWVLPTELLD